MKRTLCMLLVVLMTVCVFSACNFNTNFSDSVGLSQMAAKPEVEEMLTALGQGDSEAALALMHPDSKYTEATVAQMIRFLDGRQMKEIEQVTLNVNNTTNASGTTRKEQASFRVTLDDGEQIFLSVNHITSPDAEGFASFQIILGAV